MRLFHKSRAYIYVWIFVSTNYKAKYKGNKKKVFVDYVTYTVLKSMKWFCTAPKSIYTTMGMIVKQGHGIFSTELMSKDASMASYLFLNTFKFCFELGKRACDLSKKVVQF